MQIVNEFESPAFSNCHSIMNEALQLLQQANQNAIAALDNLARIQGDAFEQNAVRDLFPLFKVYILFSNLEEFEREILIHLYQVRSDIKHLVRRDAAPVRACELTEVETRFFTLRDRVHASGIPGKLTSVQRAILETEFLRAQKN